jgi:hypothetical protein
MGWVVQGPGWPLPGPWDGFSINYVVHRARLAMACTGLAVGYSGHGMGLP